MAIRYLAMNIRKLIVMTLQWLRSFLCKVLFMSAHLAEHFFGANLAKMISSCFTSLPKWANQSPSKRGYAPRLISNPL